MSPTVVTLTGDSIPLFDMSPTVVTLTGDSHNQPTKYRPVTQFTPVLLQLES